MHKDYTSVVKLLLSHNIQYTRGTYLLSQNIPEVVYNLAFARKCLLHRTVSNTIPELLANTDLILKNMRVIYEIDIN